MNAIFAVSAGSLSAVTAAAEGSAPAATTALGGGLPAAGLGQTLLALMLVLAVIFALAWLLRRVQGLRASATGLLRIRGGVQLGARERVIWLEAGDTHLLVGVAPGRIQTLHVFASSPAGEEDTTAGTARGPVTANVASTPQFQDFLRRALGRESP